MSISEVRREIKNFTKEDLQKLVCDLYKIIPNKKKIDYDIIAAIRDFQKNKCKLVKKPHESIKFYELEHSILSFVEYSIQNELKNNLVFSKKDKAIWIKTIMQWYNNLLLFINDESEKKLVLKLLEKIYYLLCFACGCEIFKNHDSFTSLRLSQIDFFEKIINLSIEVYAPQILVLNTIPLILNNDVDNETSKTELMIIFLEKINSDTIEKFVISDLLDRIQENGYKKIMERDKKIDTYKLFNLRDGYNLLIEFVFFSYLSISEFDLAVKFLKTKYGDTSIERIFYTMIRLLFNFGNKEVILKEIQTVRTKGKIKIRESILELEEYIMKFNELPNGF